jgi:hypothetical protein
MLEPKKVENAAGTITCGNHIFRKLGLEIFYRLVWWKDLGPIEGAWLKWEDKRVLPDQVKEGFAVA